jgi:hypothetical protein
VVQYYGSERAQTAAEIKYARVMLTTFGVVATEYSKFVNGSANLLFKVHPNSFIWC